MLATSLGDYTGLDGLLLWPSTSTSAVRRHNARNDGNNPVAADDGWTGAENHRGLWSGQRIAIQNVPVPFRAFAQLWLVDQAARVLPQPFGERGLVQRRGEHSQVVQILLAIAEQLADEDVGDVDEEDVDRPEAAKRM